MNLIIAKGLLIPSMEMSAGRGKLAFVPAAVGFCFGMAVGILYAGWASGTALITEAGALTLALGIAIQNFPEGAIISMPLHSRGLSKAKSCWDGILSGVVEPIAGLITILIASLVMPVLPYFLSFAAGAMIYVVIEELVPEMAEGEHSNWGTIAFMTGFALMMILDVALG